VEVAFYPGCTAHSTGLEYSMSLHAILERLDVSLVEMDGWNCCGAAAAHSVDTLLGLALPARNIAIAQKSDLPLSVPCAGCFNALKRAEVALSTEGKMKDDLEEVVGFTYDDSLEINAMIDVIMSTVGLEAVSATVEKPLRDLRVACYYGCALVRRPETTGMGDHENPRFMEDLVTCLGGTPLEWSYKTDCCGADLALTHAGMVGQLVDKITGSAREAGADCLMCSCGLCQLNVEMRQSGDSNGKIPVFYFSELMGIAMDLPGRKKWWKKHFVNPLPLLEKRAML
jgi:heterodisulfide reductase subunit B2